MNGVMSNGNLILIILSLAVIPKEVYCKHESSSENYT